MHIYGVILKQGTKPYKYNHMQQEKLHKGSPQVNGVFEFVRHKQSLDKEIFLEATFFQKSIMLGRTEHKLEIKALSMKAT